MTFHMKNYKHNQSTLPCMSKLDLSDGTQTKLGDVGIQGLNRRESTKSQFQFIIRQFIERFDKWIIKFYTYRVWLNFNLFFNNWTRRYINDIERTFFAFFPFKNVTSAKITFFLKAHRFHERLKFVIVKHTYLAQPFLYSYILENQVQWYSRNTNRAQ